MTHLYHLTKLDDPLLSKIKDDPVRPHIPLEQRINEAAEILMLKAEDEVLAVTCMQWLKDIPATEQDLIDFPKDHDVAVFYTIWSYSPGAGQQLIKEAAKWLKDEYKNIKAIVTLSPQTEMARRFHTKNGADTYRQNETSVNYRYYSREAVSEDSKE
jgi:Malonyl-CoA decarboxylase C-terminal domain